MSRKPRKSKTALTPSGTHVFRSKGGAIAVKVTEHPDHVLVVISGQHTGPWSRRLDRAFDAWLMPLLRPYEDDGRPVWIDHENGRRAFVHKLSDDRVVVATATAVE